MSTIASPRQSISLASRRGSTSTDTTTRSTSTSRTPGPGSGSLRRNRDALRDYYNLKTAAPADGRTEPSSVAVEVEKESELDKPDFNPQSYVHSLLAREGLEGVLRAEAGLVSEIRGLDGERKALVYDNYSKLIAATDTIRKMRMNMDPLTPTTATLTPAISHIAETAASLSANLKQQHHVSTSSADTKHDASRRTVRWVLATPDRLSQKLKDGRREEAEADWKDAITLLDRWQGVDGVEELRQTCNRIMRETAET